MNSLSRDTSRKEVQVPNGSSVTIKATLVFGQNIDWQAGDRALFYANTGYYKPVTIEVTAHPKKLGVKIHDDGDIFMVERSAIKEIIAVTGFDYEIGKQGRKQYKVDTVNIKKMKLFVYQELLLTDGVVGPKN